MITHLDHAGVEVLEVLEDHVMELRRDLHARGAAAHNHERKQLAPLVVRRLRGGGGGVCEICVCVEEGGRRRAQAAGGGGRRRLRRAHRGERRALKALGHAAAQRGRVLDRLEEVAVLLHAWGGWGGLVRWSQGGGRRVAREGRWSQSRRRRRPSARRRARTLDAKGIVDRPHAYDERVVVDLEARLVHALGRGGWEVGGGRGGGGGGRQPHAHARAAAAALVGPARPTRAPHACAPRVRPTRPTRRVRCMRGPCGACGAHAARAGPMRRVQRMQGACGAHAGRMRPMRRMQRMRAPCGAQSAHSAHSAHSARTRVLGEAGDQLLLGGVDRLAHRLVVIALGGGGGGLYVLC